uniref:Pseudouridylate synthase 1 homolog n=1 Tax=Steinernema glaseri TaxID=37863 RepID=A0A1I7YNS5_9BILA
MTKVTPEAAASSADEALHKVADGRVEKPGTSTADENIDKARKEKRGKWVRYAMMLAYQGKNYFGMQVQKGETPAIENVLLRSMHQLGYITSEEAETPYKFYFQRAARTDRAVSACRQVCSMMLPTNKEFKEQGADKLNELLPADIRVMGIRRATKTFNAQKDCDSRSYSYTLPSFAFAKLNELTKADFRITPETVEEVDSILQIFVGTHNFFNYTSKREFTDASCKRYIISFKCDKPFLYRDPTNDKEYEFITVNIRGQSFMLHQIRKMIGMTIAISRGLAYKSDIQRSFDGQRMDVPKAPGLGLLLEQVHYERYDKRWSKSHETLNHWGEETEAKLKKLKDELIVKEILDTEIWSNSMMLWLAGLPNHNFTVDPLSEEKAPLSAVAMAKHTVKVAEAALETEAKQDEHTTEGEAEGACDEKKAAATA